MPLADLHYLSVPTFLELSEFYFEMESGNKKQKTKKEYEGSSGLLKFVKGE